MGVNELVLKVPVDNVKPPLPPQNSGGNSDERRPVSSLKKSKGSSMKGSGKTHSRESSGASNLSVKFTVINEETDEDFCSASIRTDRNPDEDGVTLSDRLSQDDEDDGFHQCENIPRDSDGRLTPDSVAAIGMMSGRGDSKSQNSDYGSFCQTPCEPGGIVRPEGGQTTDGNDQQREPLLRASHEDSSSDDDAGTSSTTGYTRRRTKVRHRAEAAIEEVDEADEATQTIPGDPVKTLLAFVFLIFAWVATTTSLALTHERLPNYEPLPDIFLDNVTYQPWGLDASEIIIMVSTMVAFLVSIFHSHRSIVLRRIFLLVGLHYYYRAVTFYITVLPKPNPHYKCAPKSDNLTVMVIVKRVAELLSGMGLSINGKHVYCGDYIYSGHTMTLIMGYLVIREYSPRTWFLLHWASAATTMTGILTLLLARGHYSVDVVVAYWVTTRVWWMYHTMANNSNLRSVENTGSNYMSNMWWWHAFRYFEGNVPVNLPREYGWPVPKRLISWARTRCTPRRPPNLEDIEGQIGQE